MYFSDSRKAFLSVSSERDLPQEDLPRNSNAMRTDCPDISLAVDFKCEERRGTTKYSREQSLFLFFIPFHKNL